MCTWSTLWLTRHALSLLRGPGPAPASGQETFNKRLHNRMQEAAGLFSAWVDTRYSFPRAAVTNYCKLGGLKQQKRRSHSSGGQKSKITLSTGPPSPPSPLCLSHLLVLGCFLRNSISASVFTWLLLRVSVFSSVSYKTIVL